MLHVDRYVVIGRNGNERASHRVRQQRLIVNTEFIYLHIPASKSGDQINR